jgi:hypothetical protein
MYRLQIKPPIPSIAMGFLDALQQLHVEGKIDV